MKTTCPRCYRPTYWPRRVGNDRIRPQGLEVGTVKALTADGTCTTCWRVLKERPRLSVKGVINPTPASTRHEITDEEIRQVRIDLLKLRAARRRRGVPKQGLHPATLNRPGLTLLEA